MLLEDPIVLHTLALVLLAWWVLGLATYTLGGFVNILLVIAVVVVLLNIIGGGSSVWIRHHAPGTPLHPASGSGFQAG